MKGKEAEKPERRKEKGERWERWRDTEGGHRTTILHRKKGGLQRGDYYVLPAQGSENTGRGGASD